MAAIDAAALYQIGDTKGMAGCRGRKAFCCAQGLTR